MKFYFLRTAPLVLIGAVVALSACEVPTASLVDSDLDTEIFAATDLSTLLTQELDLSTEQAGTVQSTMQIHDRPERNPGSLWFVSTRLQDVLSERQKEKLFRLSSRARDRHVLKLIGVYAPCMVDRSGDEPSPRGIAIHLIADILTEEQLAAATEIRARYAEAIRSVREQMRSGELTREEAAAQLEELHDALVAEILGLLTQEQIDVLRQRIADRGEDVAAHVANNKRAMIEALGLSETQTSVLDELHRDQCAELQVILDAAHDGDATRQRIRAALEELIGEKMTAYERILDREQFEAAKIHDALLVINARRFLHHVKNRVNDRSNGGSETNDLGGAPDTDQPDTDESDG